MGQITVGLLKGQSGYLYADDHNTDDYINFIVYYKGCQQEIQKNTTHEEQYYRNLDKVLLKMKNHTATNIVAN